MSETQVPEAAADAALDSTPQTVDGVAVARLYGEPLFQLPLDLYIPPEALEVFLEAFEGPLDLLLYLIRRQNFNILDIPLADVTRQYLSYVDQIRKTNLELASEYLLMAAMLIEIKSRMLLPPKKSEDGAEPEDPRAELVRRLLEYEQIKLAAARLDALPVLGRDFLRAQVHIEQSLQPRFPDVSVEDLREAWLDILKRAKLKQHHRITREQLSVREHMSIVLRRLQGQRFWRSPRPRPSRRSTCAWPTPAAESARGPQEWAVVRQVEKAASGWRCTICPTASTAWVRELTPSAFSTAATWSLMVSTETPSSRAMILLGLPCSSRASTSVWRGVSDSPSRLPAVWKPGALAACWTWVRRG